MTEFPGEIMFWFHFDKLILLIDFKQQNEY